MRVRKPSDVQFPVPRLGFQTDELVDGLIGAMSMNSDESAQPTSNLDLTCDMNECKGKGTYQMAATCSNCGWQGVFTLTKGHDLGCTRDCPNCGMMRLMAQGDPQFKDKPRLKATPEPRDG